MPNERPAAAAATADVAAAVAELLSESSGWLLPPNAAQSVTLLQPRAPATGRGSFAAMLARHWLATDSALGCMGGLDTANNCMTTESVEVNRAE